MDRIGEMAGQFLAAFDTCVFEAPEGVSISEFTVSEAYQIQDAAIAARVNRGEEVVGYKVGCTSPAIRQQFGLETPVYGRLMVPFVYEADGVRLNRSDYANCAIEPEFVFRLGRDIRDAKAGRDALVEAIEFVSPGIEVHHFTFRFLPPSSQELIATNGIHACLVIGSDRVPAGALDFQTEQFRVFKDNVFVTGATSVQIMGDPIRSLEWLAGMLIERGDYLKAGQWVISGSPTELVEIKQATRLRVEISGVGSVEAHFV